MKLGMLLTVALCGAVKSERPENVTICDYYAGKVLGNSTAATQKLLLTKLINTVVLGNYTTPNNGVKVLGIASPATYNGTDINLLPLFTGAYNSTNTGGTEGTQKLFLDDGGAVALSMSRPSNGTNSVQYHLLTHIYQYFGTILKCTKQGGEEFPAYQGRTSMYEVHRFMNLDKYQNGFFILQVQTAALSLGFSHEDTTTFGNLLQKFFNFRCSPATAVSGIHAAAEFQSVCTAENCPLDPEGGDCSVYPNKGVALVPVNVSALTNGNGASSSGPSASVPTTTTGDAPYTSVVLGTITIMALVVSLLVFSI